MRADLETKEVAPGRRVFDLKIEYLDCVPPVHWVASDGLCVVTSSWVERLAFQQQPNKSVTMTQTELSREDPWTYWDAAALPAGNKERLAWDDS
ncbi:hypothetical protein [Streptomyces sp. KR55]|uniref:hypothetical protein n=1 Tax=Streptomyces sp. KR55 TaxID=3457425 RepID=UPI003FD3D4C1